MRVSVEYYDVEPREAVKSHEEEWGIISCPEKPRDRRWSWLGHVLRMPEHRLVRQVLLNCVKPTHEKLFADVPKLSIENATKMSKDRKLWSSNRPSPRCKPLSGGVAIK